MLKLLQYSPGRQTSAPQYRVLIPGTASSCPILEELLASSDGEKMLRLFDEVVSNGLPNHDPNKCKHLSGQIFEFKRGPKRGPKLRVFAFRDRYDIVLTSVNAKKRNDDPTKYIERGEEVRKKYFNAKANGELATERFDD